MAVKQQLSVSKYLFCKLLKNGFNLRKKVMQIPGLYEFAS